MNLKHNNTEVKRSEDKEETLILVSFFLWFENAVERVALKKDARWNGRVEN